MLCKFTPLGFETFCRERRHKTRRGVNLPRWGLKPNKDVAVTTDNEGVNLPRWGLKHDKNVDVVKVANCVNLPRWGLKHWWRDLFGNIGEV